MTDNSNQGTQQPEKKKGLFSRFKKERDNQNPDATPPAPPAGPATPGAPELAAPDALPKTDPTSADGSDNNRPKWRALFTRGGEQPQPKVETSTPDSAQPTAIVASSSAPSVATATTTQKEEFPPPDAAIATPAPELPIIPTGATASPPEKNEATPSIFSMAANKGATPTLSESPPTSQEDISRFARLKQAFSRSEGNQQKPAPSTPPQSEQATSPIPSAAIAPKDAVTVSAATPAPPASVLLQPSAPPSPQVPTTAAPLSGSITTTPAASNSHENRFGRIKQALARTGKGLGRVFLGRKQIDDDLLESLETQLLTSDLGIEVTAEVIATLTDRVKRKELGDVAALQAALKALLIEILAPCEKPLAFAGAKPFVLLTVGVNGVGKTTTIGKLAKQAVNSGRSVMLAAGDTFRAAAVEQLQVWGERNHVPVVAQHTGADSASVIYDAVESARARHVDLLIADTAGRLHTKSNLMEELKKIKRVLAKLDPSAPHEVLLVLDAGTGQNAVNQLQQFHEAVGVTGIVLTKLDGTAKGGVIFALCRRFGIPVRYIGVGEGVDDLQPFKAAEFVDALLSSGALE